MVCNILGLGDSLKEHPGDGFDIGVNDIWRIRKTDIVVCVDNPRRFEGERKRALIECTPSMFYSQLDEWQFKPGFTRINFHARRGFIDLDSDKIAVSNNSPFVAVNIAYKLGASRIRLYGVDMVNHHILSKDQYLKTALKHFHEMYLQLKRVHVTLSTTRHSRLSSVLPIN